MRDLFPGDHGLAIDRKSIDFVTDSTKVARMVPVFYLLVGLVFLFIKKFPVSGKKELRRPRTYIASSITFLSLLLSNYFPIFIVEDRSLMGFMSVVLLVVPLIAFFVLAQPKEQTL